MLKKFEIALYVVVGLLLLWMVVSFFEVNSVRELASGWNFFKVILKMYN
jgi:uncharacterized membrane protein